MPGSRELTQSPLAPVLGFYLAMMMVGQAAAGTPGGWLAAMRTRETENQDLLLPSIPRQGVAW